MPPAPLIVPATTRHTATVIFAHGLGDTGAGWIDVVRNWRLRSKLNSVKFVLPNAPSIPITCNMGMRMPGWFDIASLDGSVQSLLRQEDESGMTETRKYLESLIKKEIDAGIPANRIIIGGFSQGGAMALLTGLTGEYKLGGILALSCWLVLSGKFKDILKDDLKNTPIFMAHGTEDPIVRPEFNKMSRDVLKTFDITPEFHEYPMPHSACPEEIDDVSAFMEKLLEQSE